jgi:hypothetical protein
MILISAVLLGPAFLTGCGGGSTPSRPSKALTLTSTCGTFTEASTVAKEAWAREEGRPEESSAAESPGAVQDSMGVLTYYCSADPSLSLARVPTIRNFRTFLSRGESAHNLVVIAGVSFAETQPGSLTFQNPLQPDKQETYAFKGDPAAGGHWVQGQSTLG